MIEEILEELLELSEKMNRVANKMMDFSDDTSCQDKENWKRHARELIGAASITREWADCISDEGNK